MAHVASRCASTTRALHTRSARHVPQSTQNSLTLHAPRRVRRTADVSLRAEGDTSGAPATSESSRAQQQPPAPPTLALQDVIDLDAELEEQDMTADEDQAEFNAADGSVVDEADDVADPVEQQDQVIEAVLEAGAPAQDEVIEEEVTEVLLQDIPPSQYLQSAGHWLRHSKLGIATSIAAAAVLGGTLALAALRTYQKVNSTQAKRKRQVSTNKALVDELATYLPGNAAALTPDVAKKLQRKTGFTSVEIFRKYLWFLLRERKFDQEAVDDLAQLRGALQLSDSEVAEALKERAQRVYDKYGGLMLNTAGMTAEGVERKATSHALFQKLLFLTECEAMVAQGFEAAASVNLREIFGATEEDIDRMRLVSLVDVDWDVLESLATGGKKGGSIPEAGGDEDDDSPYASR